MKVKIDNAVDLFRDFNSPEYQDYSLVIEGEDGHLTLYIYNLVIKKVLSALIIPENLVSFHIYFNVNWIDSNIMVKFLDQSASYDVVKKRGITSFGKWQ